MSLSKQPISPLDGRYQDDVYEIAEHLSEAGLNRARVRVEVEWLIKLAKEGFAGTTISEIEIKKLREFSESFDDSSVKKIAGFEAKTKHDVKAVEYFVREHLANLKLDRLSELTHFACTSEDINNLAYGITLTEAVKKVWRPELEQLLASLTKLAEAERETPMLSRTHGQPATPTTFGKEIAVFVHRIKRVAKKLDTIVLTGKFSGATGTFSAHLVAAPEFDWLRVSKEFVESLGLEWNPLTTQIESHDTQSELLNRIGLINRILHNLCTDIWTYIAFGFITQIPVKGATGSSTMPHKVNPIRFENAEANLELANAVGDSLASTLVTSRMQRDLTDSTSQRNLGVALGHSLLALKNIRRGLDDISVNRAALSEDLDANIEVLGEAIQTVLRAERVSGNTSINNPYDLLKELTRGNRITRAEMEKFISELEMSAEGKKRLLELRPANYTGLASKLVDFLK